MKRVALYILFWCIAFASTASAQEFEVSLTVGDGANSAVLMIGVHPSGTDGFDAGLDIFAPPPPPPGAFDARSVIGGEAFVTDIRDNTTTEKVFRLRYQPASGQGPIVLTWDPTGLSMLGSFFITDDITGELFGPLDMTTTNQLDVSTAEGLLDDGVRVLVMPSMTQENNAPVALDDDATTDEDTSLNVDVLDNDTDPDDDALTVVQVSNPSNGAASINAAGMIHYAPDADFHGTDSFAYTVIDPGGLTAQATVTVTVTPVNDAPVFAGMPPTNATEGQAYSYTATATDVDGDRLTLTAPTLPAWLIFADQGDGTATLDGTPGEDDRGNHDVVIEASDGAAMAQQTFTITVSEPGNRAPTAQDDQAITEEDTPLDLNVLVNDTDPDSDALSVTQVVDPLHGTTSINADGTVRYNPEADFHGNDRFTYIASDPGGLTAQGTVLVTVTPVNDAPVITSSAVTGATADEAYRYAIEAADVDVDVLSVTAPTHPAWLLFMDNGDGTAALEGTPAQTDAGPHDILIEVTDGVETAQQAFTLTVTGTMGNLPPEATTLTVPADRDTVRLEGDPRAAFIVEWNAADDPNGDEVRYRWELSLTQTFATRLFNEDVDTATRFETDVGTVATALTASGIPVRSALKVFHRVVTSDGTNETVGPAFAVILVRGVLVEVEEEALPTRFALLGNYPNPFMQRTIIRYTLAEPANVRLVVFDTMGRQVAVLVDAVQRTGYHERVFNASLLSSGMYFYQLQAGRFSQVKEMTFLR